MELWFSERHTKGVKFSIKVDRQLFSGHSEFQRIDIFDSKEFGRFLALDGYMMLTEKDEFIYHEMIVHVPMAVHPNVKKVLVIGAGDGGVIRELCCYETIETIDMVEIDELVVEVSKKYLPTTACCFDDPRLNIYYQDGLKFVRTKENEYDLIIVDSTDPFGPGEGLFTKEFYGNCFKALNETGIMVISMKVHFIKMMLLQCNVLINELLKVSQFLEYIKRIFQLILQDIGYLVLLPKNIIQSRIFKRQYGMLEECKLDIIIPEYM